MSFAVPPRVKQIGKDAFTDCKNLHFGYTTVLMTQKKRFIKLMKNTNIYIYIRIDFLINFNY